MISQTNNLFLHLEALNWDDVLEFKYVVIHESDTEDGPGVSAHAIESYHVNDNGWSEVGYNFLVERAPEGDAKDAMSIFVGRAMTKSGSHVEGLNHKAIGICCVGQYDQKPPDERHVETTAYIVQLLKKFFKERKNINLEVLGHRECYALLGQPVKKTCPGIAWDMDAFRKLC